MHRTLAVLLALTGLTLAVTITTLALGRDSSPRKERKPFGIDKRELWTTSKVKGTPEPPDPYRLENVFPNLQFDEPLELSILPGSNRWVVAERRGKIYTFANDPKTAKKHLLLDLGKTVYGVVMHPNFAKNGYFYVSYLVDPEKNSPEGSRLVRFKVKQFDPPEADPKSETLILTWPSGGHNGGCLRFGPDGYLYLGTGDGSGIADGRQTGQDLSDLLGSILRIDVDRTEKGRPYAIPADNPFIKHKGARPEVYAYGVRQPWKFSFDAKTGDIWAGEVGQDLWDMILRIEKGGNYGWSIVEGTHPFRPERKRGPTPILPPAVEHPHSEFRSITGGYFFKSPRLPELQGAYVYGDYDTGRVWQLRWDGKKVSDNRELAHSRIRIVAWGQDHEGRRLRPGLHRQRHLPAGQGPAAGRGRPEVPTQAEPDRTFRLHEGSEAGRGTDSLFGQRGAVVGRGDQGALPGDSGQGADRIQHGDLSAAGPWGAAGLALPG